VSFNDDPPLGLSSNKNERTNHRSPINKVEAKPITVATSAAQSAGVIDGSYTDLIVTTKVPPKPENLLSCGVRLMKSISSIRPI
jgi:hypothetical protein